MFIIYALHMKKALYLGIGAAALMLAGCSSAPSMEPDMRIETEEGVVDVEMTNSNPVTQSECDSISIGDGTDGVRGMLGEPSMSTVSATGDMGEAEVWTYYEGEEESGSACVIMFMDGEVYTRTWGTY